MLHIRGPRLQFSDWYGIADARYVGHEIMTAIRNVLLGLGKPLANPDIGQDFSFGAQTKSLR
jgi:hypothetical protein